MKHMKTWMVCCSASIILVSSFLFGFSNVGSQFYAIKLTNIATAGQVATFGFTSSKISLTTPSGNTSDVCVHWTDTSATTCPSANTAGDDLIPAGTSLILDDINVTGISVKTATGTQTMYIRAWR